MTWPDWDRPSDDGGGHHYGRTLLFSWLLLGFPLMVGFEVRWYWSVSISATLATIGIVLELRRGRRVRQEREQRELLARKRSD